MTAEKPAADRPSVGVPSASAPSTEDDRYAVIGSPIAHSKSPAIHTAFAAQTQQALTYGAADVLPAELDDFVATFFADGGCGLNVTMPHKERVFALADVATPRASLARAANTLSRNAEGQLVADNTDGAGLLGDLESHGVSLRQKRILFLGAGGATRGVLAAIADLTAERPEQITVANRTVAKAHALREDFSQSLALTAVGYVDLGGSSFDLIINGTSASLGGELPPLAEGLVAPGCCCYDMMYAAEPTPFQRWAQENHATLVLDGLGMLVGQAAESFLVWRGVRPATSAVVEELRATLRIP